MLAFDVIDHADLRIISVPGDIDGTNAHDLEFACSDAHVKRIVVVDLLACPYIDSTGLTALIKATHFNPLVLILAPTCRIYRIFAITDLLSYFTIFQTLDEALAHRPVGERPAAPAAGHAAAGSFA